MQEYESLPYDQLRELHRTIGVLLQTRKREALEQLKGHMAALGFTAEDLAPKKVRGNGKPGPIKYP
jgi:hypothetical protein